MSRTFEWLALALVVIGALNWGLVGLAQFDLVATLFGGQTAPLSRIVYGLVGLAGVALLALRSRRELVHSAA
jgi:MYXO-CTERM domain-containing protein